MRLLLGIFVGYVTVGVVRFWTITGLMHPTLLFIWAVPQLRHCLPWQGWYAPAQHH